MDEAKRGGWLGAKRPGRWRLLGGCGHRRTGIEWKADIPEAGGEGRSGVAESDAIESAGFIPNPTVSYVLRGRLFQGSPVLSVSLPLLGLRPDLSIAGEVRLSPCGGAAPP